MSNPAFNGGPPLHKPDAVGQIVVPSLSPNDQLYLSSHVFEKALPQIEGPVRRIKEHVDLYVVKYPEALGGVGSGGMKFMVIESHIPPKYHKVMASYPKTVLQYDVNDLNPTISFTNREKALATLKDGTLVTYTTHTAAAAAVSVVQQPPLLHQQLPVATVPMYLSSAFTASDAPKPRTGFDSKLFATVSNVPSISASNDDSVIDFGGFIPLGIADDVIFVAENESTGRKTSSPPIETSSKIDIPAEIALPAESLSPVPFKGTVVSATEFSVAIPPAVVPVAILQGVKVELGQPLTMIQPAAIALPVELKTKTQNQVAAIPKAISSKINETSADKMDVITPVAEAQALATVTTFGANGKEQSVTPIQTEKDVVKVEAIRNSSVHALHQAQLVGRSEPVQRSEPVHIKSECIPPVVGSIGPVLVPENEAKVSNKRNLKTDSENGMMTWKRRCLAKSDKSLPTFDEATDLFRNDPYCSYDAFGDVLDRADSSVLKRDSLEAKDIRSLTSSLALTAKSMQKNSKINGKDNSGSEITGQSMWSEDDSNQAEENIDEADASGKAQLDWVQCDSCKKWRTLPLRTHPKYPTSLDEDKGWICSMNSWAPHLAKCMVPEESMLSPTAIKIRVWLRRIRTGDRYEARNNLKSAYDKKTAGSNFIKSVPVDWIRCCSPVCGKWRACLRTMNGDDVRVVQYPWYCWMGSWDETKATCSAPQEGFGSQGYKVALTETSDKKDGPAYSNTVQNAANSNALNNSAANNSGGAKKSVNGRADNNGNDDTAIEVEAPEGGDDDESQPTIGISSRGRIVRSKFNVRKHLANSKKTF